MSFGNNVKHGGDFALNLFIDDGVKSRGHRNYMLNADFKYTGIAYCKHKSAMKGMVVIVYAKQFELNKKGVAEIEKRRVENIREKRRDVGEKRRREKRR